MNNPLTIPFHNQTIVAFERDGQAFIAMKPIVENLGLAWQPQHRKIVEKFGKGITMMVTPSAGGLQETLCLPLSKIAGFLYSINASKVKPELHDIVIAYQEECDAVLFNHFINSANAKSHALIDGLFKKHRQWRETYDLLTYGFTTREVAGLQGKHICNVQRMQKRMCVAGLLH